MDNEKTLIIGIDPDTEKSGFASYAYMEKKLKVVDSFSFFQIFDFLQKHKDSIALVRIEAGWLNKKSNFHNNWKQSKTVGERIAAKVGANHETGKKLIEMCEYLSIPVEAVRPLGTKNIDAKLFKELTGVMTRTNPDKRDAAMLVWEFTPVKTLAVKKVRTTTTNVR